MLLMGIRIYKNPGPSKATIAPTMTTAKQETIIVTGTSQEIGAVAAALLLASPVRRSPPPISAVVP
jgi:hypothetical protein